MLVEGRILLSIVILQFVVSDYCRGEGGYSVRLGYQVLTSNDSHFLDASEKLIWHSQV